MLFKPSPRTIKLMRRGNWLFFPLWLGTLAYIWLSAEGAITLAWNQLFLLVFGLLFAANFVYALLALNSARQDAKRSQHPDPDVAAVIDGEIEIAEYGRRKSLVPSGSTSQVLESPTGTKPPLTSRRPTEGDA